VSQIVLIVLPPSMQSLFRGGEKDVYQSHNEGDCNSGYSSCFFPYSVYAFG
jgi:hypothetical protein